MGGHVASATPMAALANPMRWANRFFCVFTSANLGLLFTLLQCLCGITPKRSLALVKLYLLHVILFFYSSFIDTKLGLFDFL